MNINQILNILIYKIFFKKYYKLITKVLLKLFIFKNF